ncbi:hypothetical protein Ddye_009603 [Dipteronia dyeriana]|uniref:SelT-like protein n=1 Tax=Dipteronia dyeriana TaxID=168575 RepID=A0AAD9XBN6_9ROSI|nr:hypothetical protein Ddye_009603 [Dipteronia dyeriana]
MDGTKFVQLFCSDILSIFMLPLPPPSPPPPPPTHMSHDHSLSRPLYRSVTQFVQNQPIHISNFDQMQKTSSIGSEIGVGSIIMNINFCSSCSYIGNAVTMKNMLEAAFPGINVILANHPPSAPKRLLSKVVLIVQVGMFGIVVAGEQMFPRLGIATPPSWYYSFSINKFRNIAGTWLLGNFIQSYLQSSGAFEVYCNGELVFSKLMEQRFPREIELKDLVSKRLINLRVVSGIGEGFLS